MKAIDRLLQYIKYKGIKPARFEKDLGLSNGYLGTQKRRNADLGESIVVKIINYCRDINISWLLMGEGPMLRDGAGDPIVTDTPKAPEQPRPTQNTTSMDQIYRTAAGDSSGEMLLNIIRMKDEELREQAIEIGRLRERISLIQSGTQIVGGGKLPNPPTQMPPAQAAPAPLPPDPEPPTPKPAKLPLARLQSASCATDASRNVPK